MDGLARLFSPHPDDRELAAYVDGAQTPGDAAEIAAHLTWCSECREAVDLAREVTREEEANV